MMREYEWQHRSPNPKRHLDRFSPFCTAYSRVAIPVLYNRPPVFPLKIALYVWASGPPVPHLIHGSLGPYNSCPKWHLDLFSNFCRAHCTVISDGQTDRPQYFICNNRLHSASAVMQTKNTRVIFAVTLCLIILVVCYISNRVFCSCICF